MSFVKHIKQVIIKNNSCPCCGFKISLFVKGTDLDNAKNLFQKYAGICPNCKKKLCVKGAKLGHIIFMLVVVATVFVFTSLHFTWVDFSLKNMILPVVLECIIYCVSFWFLPISK
ncbi:MAG: hypothetical protein E7653_02715 [Ruminococcaceae bacterium]|nr:hypothetical protein [Oscillospiraceae bacterium]